ncbi:6-phosphogluconolactonase [Cystobacter fuscus DSM 2262]|uniref:6-phosphogluconolactonase n=1 Tax=Cystobacter fuscus (strain ATCC 25194 / DSM 2262 / NBRC 100088 / M29) TaxID=1242864 RepID=S9P8A7_CYSF2|nr:lactonase family protein [Cystobacter fuscus]EPX59386.1 6-phosphogluconolactonase [Cystobacter fuscus DSM 2262]
MNPTNITRRDFVYLMGLGTTGIVLSCSDGEPTPQPQPPAPTELWLYVGTYTSGGSEGIYLCRLDLATGALQKLAVTPNVAEPSYLALDPKGRYLYAVNELVEYEGKPSGAVSAFAINAQSRELTFINRQSSQGGAPCYLEVDATGAYVLVANYVGGNVAVLPILPDGGLGAVVDLKQHQDPPTAHAHQIRLDAANQYALAPDLGLDKIMIYRFDAKQGKLTPGEPASFSTHAKAGPRHLDFHPNGKFAFGINELDSTIIAFSYDKERGALTELQTVSSLPEGYTGTSYCADIHVSPDGRFLYGSNRGHDSIVVFAIDSAGKLTLVEHVTGGINWPRNFAIDPTGAYLLVANQKGNTVVNFRRDAQTGRLTSVGQPLDLPAPTCLLVVPPSV